MGQLILDSPEDVDLIGYTLQRVFDLWLVRSFLMIPMEYGDFKQIGLVTGTIGEAIQMYGMCPPLYRCSFVVSQPEQLVRCYGTLFVYCGTWQQNRLELFEAIYAQTEADPSNQIHIN